MNVRVTLALLVVLVVLGTGVYWSELRSEPTPTPTPTGSKLLDFDPNRVSELSIDWAGKQAVVRKDSGGQWQLAKPEVAPAAAQQVEGAVYALSTLKSSRDIVVKTAELATYGLDQPQGTIMVTMGPGESQRLIVGSANPDRSGYYSRRPFADEQVVVHVLPAAFVDALKRMVDSPPRVPPTPVPAAPTPAPTAAP